MELVSSELEWNCLRDFVPESKLNWNLLLLEFNCKNGIDPGAGTDHPIRDFTICRVVVKYRYLYLHLYLSTILSVLDVREYLIGENAKYLYLYLIQSTW